MAAQVNDTSQLINGLEKVRISEANEVNYDCANDTQKWGLPLTEVYKLALSFYKGRL